MAKFVELSENHILNLNDILYFRSLTLNNKESVYIKHVDDEAIKCYDNLTWEKIKSIYRENSLILMPTKDGVYKYIVNLDNLTEINPTDDGVLLRFVNNTIIDVPQVPFTWMQFILSSQKVYEGENHD